MLDIAPEDKKQIGEFCDAVRRSCSLHMIESSLSLKELGRFVRSLPSLPTFKKWSVVSLAKWCPVHITLSVVQELLDTPPIRFR